MHHVAKVCKSSHSKAASVLVFDTAKSGNVADVNAITPAGLFSLESPYQLPSTPSDVPSILNYIRTSEGPVTTLPLPHHVHDAVAGWHATRPRDSPTIMATFSVDKKSYAELGLNQPRRGS